MALTTIFPPSQCVLNLVNTNQSTTSLTSAIYSLVHRPLPLPPSLEKINKWFFFWYIFLSVCFLLQFLINPCYFLLLATIRKVTFLPRNIPSRLLADLQCWNSSWSITMRALHSFLGALHRLLSLPAQWTRLHSNWRLFALSIYIMDSPSQYEYPLRERIRNNYKECP